MKPTRTFTALAAAIAMATTATAHAVPGLDTARARVQSATAGQALSAASSAGPRSVVKSYLGQQGRSDAVLGSLNLTGSRAGDDGITHLRMEQRVEGKAIHGAYVKAAVNSRGELVHLIDHTYEVSAAAPGRINAQQALAAALAHLYPTEKAVGHAVDWRGNSTLFDAGSFFHGKPKATAVLLPLEDGTLAEGWVVETWTAKSNQLHHTVIDGEGEVLAVESRTANDSYNVFVEDPGKGAQAVVNGPGTGNAQSPSGWLGTGAQTTFAITGNNTRTYLDTDANNAADSGGTAVTTGNFTTAANLGQQPSTTGNKAVAVQNLFYLNNVAHDRLYAHGFDEAAGNFQSNNFGKGGVGNDPVNAEAQDGSGTDNANFSTTADGSAPRMQMYLWSGLAPTALVTVNGTSYGAYSSSFGAALTATGITGPLAVYNDNTGVASDGCEAAAAGSLSGRIAIVDRGTCNFTVKVRNAQNAGATAVIIANNEASGAFAPGGTDRKVKISSAMVSQTDGATLKAMAGASANLKKNPVAPLQIDGDLDSDIVFHEYGHGLTWRMIGGMSGTLAGAIGEGASDVVAFLINGDDRIGEYSYSNALGIRRAPYEGYAFTYANVGNAGYEVHNDGEIYAAAMWKVRANYIAAGLSADDVMHDFVRGMNFTPATPAFEDMRDGMLAAVGTDSLRQCAIWKGFAAQGIGVGADGVVSRRGAVTIKESFTVPAACLP
jgi:hypothetical protein